MKTLLLVLLLSQVRGATPLDFEVAKSQFAGAVAFREQVVDPSPAPDDDPAPQPGVCQVCNGTGKVYPDGRIEQECQACGGDGHIEGKITRISNRPRQILSALWGDSLQEGRQKQMDRQVPMVLMFCGEAGTCPPCEKLEHWLENPELRDVLNQSVCVRVVGDDTHPDFIEWEIFRVPSLFVVSADFQLTTEVMLTSNEADFVNNLKRTIYKYQGTATQEAPVKVKQTSIPIEQRRSSATITPVQYGSQGGAPMYSYAPTYSYAYTAPSYGSNGGGYSAPPSYGSNGGSPSYSYGYAQPQYYSQPQYYAPTYSQPSYSYGGYGYRYGGYSGRTMVCGPNGCYFQ